MRTSSSESCHPLLSSHHPVLWGVTYCMHAHRLKDIISALNSSHIYLVLECLDCDLRHYLDTCVEASNLSQIKVGQQHPPALFPATQQAPTQACCACLPSCSPSSTRSSRAFTTPTPTSSSTATLSRKTSSSTRPRRG